MKRFLYILTLSIGLAMSPLAATALDNTPQVRVEATTATGGNGRITLSAAGSDAVFGIYSITGQLLKTIRLSADAHVTIDMPNGFYIVRCNGQWSRKVVVK